MARKFEDDARRAIEAIEKTGITEREGVLVLVFGRRKQRVAGYLNDNPYVAALAMVEFLIQRYPNARRPAWVRRLMARHPGRKTRGHP